MRNYRVLFLGMEIITPFYKISKKQIINLKGGTIEFVYKVCSIFYSLLLS
jgi:hypothetical protein